jgi:CRP/FNR family cyclic AMP-dependent transcriptional regulator
MPTPVPARDLLANSPLFSGLGEPAIRRLVAVLLPRTFERDATIYLRGDEALGLYGIASGRVRFSAASMEGKEVVLDYAAAGQWFGEIGLFDAGPRVVDAFAAEATELLLLKRSDLLGVCRDEPELPFRFLELFSRRIRTAEDIIVDASFLSLPARLAKKLLALASEGATAGAAPIAAPSSRIPAALSLRISQDELGRLTGVTRESAGKQLKAWEREGLVALEYGRIVVRDAAALRRIVVAAVGE